MSTPDWVRRHRDAVPDQVIEVNRSAGSSAPPVLQGTIVAVGERELPAIFPDWAVSPAGIRAYAEWRARRATHMLVFHLLRTPKYGLRITGRSLVGAGRGVRGLWRWVFDADASPLRYQAINDGDSGAYLRMKILHRQDIKRRGSIVGATLLAAVTGAAAEAYWLPHTILYTEAVAAVAVAAWHGALDQGGDADGRSGIFDVPDGPVLPVELTETDLNDAFAAMGLLKGDARLVMVRRPMLDGNGWSVIFDLPRGSGRTAAHAIAKRDILAAELGVDEIQLDMRRIRAIDGGSASRVSLWVCDEDPYLAASDPSPLLTAERFDFWQPVPFGRDARGNRVSVEIIWQSMFFGGYPRRGKTAAQRLLSAAGALDAGVRHWVAGGKGGADWEPMRAIAHRFVPGADDEGGIEALQEMLDEIIEQIAAANRVFATIPLAIIRDGKLTPQIIAQYGLSLNLITIDELQKYLAAVPDKAAKDALVNRLVRIVLAGPSAGYICNFASQRPDAESVPTALRDNVTRGFCTQVKDRTSSDMVLGAGMAAQGADASILSEDHVGVGVLVNGPDTFTTVKCDYIDLVAFEEICRRGRALRLQAATLSGDAATGQAPAANSPATTPQVLTDALTVLGNSDRIHAIDLIEQLRHLHPATYQGWDTGRLANNLRDAGVVRSTIQVKIGGANRNGYHRADLETAATRYPTTGTSG